MASGPITSWQIDRETMKTVRDFIVLSSKISADGDCSHEIRDAWSLKEKLWFFQWSCMDVRIGLQRKLSTKELMLLNCGVGEDS